MDRAIERGRPIIVAIKQYEADHGRAPRSLANLIPKYIASLPSTGIRISPEFLYTVDDPKPGVWYLSVRLERIGFKSMTYYSDGRHGGSGVTDLSEGWRLYP
jgi:hypothetical protein